VNDSAGSASSPSAPIVVAAYDPAWPRRFEAERALLERVLAQWLEGGVHHIGSTAVPGLAAKPIIDILVGVRNLQEAQDAFEPLREQGYEYLPHRPRAHHFAKPARERAPRTHGLHLTERGSDLWLERLAFRDALRADPDLAADYQALKLRLAQAHAADIGSYTVGKRAFVARVLAGAGLTIPATSPR
jgi:GrpB-like predicted nucleotidyltransferase (UPF0157 family)